MTIQAETTTYSLRRARKARGMRIQDLAEATRLHPRTISNIEWGRSGHRTCYDTAYAIADALGMRITDILWPNGLTDKNQHRIGARWSNDSGAEADKPATCPTCFTALPLSTHRCDYCD